MLERAFRVIVVVYVVVCYTGRCMALHKSAAHLTFLENGPLLTPAYHCVHPIIRDSFIKPFVIWKCLEIKMVD